ncbi:uncharacterized protein LOC132733811 isoform X3 [Ruditapes philippinarum]|uniref:uncharacterized protein LOC132733811 isoform X3 n=1 Tax=Ruditapes philippinarum TaxID=129788 RepID=UPI00295C0792|nr:uncharacterized protein LOC132733811 isoform X3 [Ruditapes philippinarum]
MSSQAFFPTFQTKLYTMDTSMIVYRVLRPDENPECLTANNPFAFMFTVFDHVSNGNLSTQFISTCKSKAAVMDFAEKGKYFPTGLRKIVSINLTKLMQLVPRCEIIDLTLPGVLNSYIPDTWSGVNSRARNFATKFQEVLIKLPVIQITPVRIPAECVAVIGYV